MNELGRSDFQYYPYDPVFPEYGDPREADLVCCIDVLEHVEPNYLKAVLKDLSRITIKAGLFTIHTGPAGKNLPDGRNAHLIQKPSSWWLPQLCEHFEIAHLQRDQWGYDCRGFGLSRKCGISIEQSRKTPPTKTSQ